MALGFKCGGSLDLEGPSTYLTLEKLNMAHDAFVLFNRHQGGSWIQCKNQSDQHLDQPRVALAHRAVNGLDLC